MACVLVVEDDGDIREMLAVFLEFEGYEVMTATNGLEALAVMRERRPCLVLLDLMMPVLTGWDFRRRQLADPAIADVPVIAVTAMSDPQEIARELNLRGLGKPIGLDEIAREVAAVCHHRPIS